MAGPWEAYSSAAAAPEANAAAGPWSQYAATQSATKQAAAEPTVSMPEAVARGAAQGLTANFYDELRGLVEAGGAKQQDPASLYSMISGLYRRATGADGAEDTYNATTARERALTKEAETQRPNSTLAGNVGGTIAATLLPVGRAVQAAELPARMVQGAKVGAATGALYGAGEGEGLKDSLLKAGQGLVTGGGLGAAGVPIVEGIIRGGRAIAQPIANAVRGVTNVDDEAARRIALSIQRDIKIDPTAEGRLTPKEFGDSVRSGGPATLTDIGGETTRALARSAANTSPEGRQALTKVIDDRYEGQAPRVVEWLNKNFNYPDAGGLQQAIDSVAKTVNRPAYAKAYAKGQSLWDDELGQLSQAPVVQQAIRLAFVTGRNKDALAGFAPIKMPFSMNKATGEFELMPGATPNLQFWDHVKRNLDKLGAEGQAHSKALRAHLDDLVPEYQQARAGAASFFGAEDALDAGKKFVGSGMDTRDAARNLAKLSAGERKLFQDGFVSEYTNKLNKVGDRRSILNKIADSPAARQQLEMVLGPQKAKELEATLRVEGIMDLARGAVQGNSTTARQLAELGLAGGAFGFSGGVTNPTDPSAIMNAAVVYGALKGKNKINENLSRRVAEMLSSNDPAVLLRGIKAVSNNQQLFNSLRSADRGLARIGGQQSAGIPALQAAGVGRAEDQQNVPRPPGQ